MVRHYTIISAKWANAGVWLYDSDYLGETVTFIGLLLLFHTDPGMFQMKMQKWEYIRILKVLK